MAEKNRPPVDIIIPFHGQYELVADCVGSILACTPNQDYQIILVDDGSPNKTFLESLSRNRAILPVRLPEQKGFGAALALGFAASQANHLVFMHSDVKVTNLYWLINLQRALEEMKKTGVKLVSARASSPGTSGSFDERMFGNNDAVDDFVSEVATPLICSYCHRELFKRIGGFVKQYKYGWYEDEELFWRMKYYNFKQAVIGNTWVKHEGGATIKELWKNNPDAKKTMEDNRKICLEDVRPFVKNKPQSQKNLSENAS